MTDPFFYKGAKRGEDEYFDFEAEMAADTYFREWFPYTFVNSSKKNKRVRLLYCRKF